MSLNGDVKEAHKNQLKIQNNSILTQSVVSIYSFFGLYSVYEYEFENSTSILCWYTSI